MVLNLENHDFTLNKFSQLCEVIVQNYPTITVAEYLEKQCPNKFVIMRHDIDRMPGNALKTAKIEQELGIRSTYYFRSNKNVFRPKIIKQIEDMGHEIGYHYETLSEANGDYEKAIEIFRSTLDEFRKISDVKTICMHGKPLSKYDNRDIWNVYDFRDYDIIGEAYLSLDKGLDYLSDTGRNWGSGNNLRDFIPGKKEKDLADKTDDIIEVIKSNKIDHLYILTHPERWSSNIAEWSLYYSVDHTVNLGKKMLMMLNRKDKQMPQEKNSSLSVTVDIEDWYHIPSVCGSTFSVYKDVNEFFENWKDRYDYLTEPTGRVLDLLDEFNITATFFVVADVAENYPGLIESIVERGHEIACHGSHHTCKINLKTKQPLMSIEEFETDALEAKQILEKISGQEVIGYRAPNAAVTGEMLNSLERLGYKYDSSVSVNSLYNKTDSSLQGVSSIPYYPASGSLEPTEKRDFVEFPWAYYDTGIKIPSSGGPMLRFLGANVILKGLKQSLDRGHTIFYFHSIDISNEDFPRIGKGRPMYWSIKGNVVEKKIRHVLKNLKHVEKVPLRDLVQ